jgi:hypothetical protein
MLEKWVNNIKNSLQISLHIAMYDFCKPRFRSGFFLKNKFIWFQSMVEQKRLMLLTYNTSS